MGGEIDMGMDWGVDGWVDAQSIHGWAGGWEKKTYVRVTDGVTAGARDDELPIESFQEPTQFVVGDDLLEAELEVFEQGGEVLLGEVGGWVGGWVGGREGGGGGGGWNELLWVVGGWVGGEIGGVECRWVGGWVGG